MLPKRVNLPLGSMTNLSNKVLSYNTNRTQNNLDNVQNEFIPNSQGGPSISFINYNNPTINMNFGDQPS